MGTDSEVPFPENQNLPTYEMEMFWAVNQAGLSSMALIQQGKAKLTTVDLNRVDDSLTTINIEQELSISSSICSEKKQFKAVTARNNISFVEIHRRRDLSSHIFLAKTFDALDQLQLSPILVTTSSTHVSIALVLDGTRSTQSIEADITVKLDEAGTIHVTQDMTLLTLVGEGRESIAAWEYAIFSALANADIDVAMLSKGSNGTNFSLVVHRKNMPKVLRIAQDTTF